MRLLMIAALALTMAACTTTSSMRLSSDTLVLTTRGNAFTMPEKVQRDLMVEAAQQTQAAGYAWFVIDGSQDMTTRGVAYFPGQADAAAACNAYVCAGAASATGPTAVPYTKPGMQVRIHMGSGAAPKGGYDAAQLLSYLAPKKK